MKTKSQIEKDIAFCIDECDMTDDQIGEVLRACESLGNIAVEYFCEEFIFVDEEGTAYERWHDENHLNIAEFNALYWDGNDSSN